MTCQPITCKNCFPPCELWGSLFRDKYTKFHSDNMAVVHIINSQLSKDCNIMYLSYHITGLHEIQCSNLCTTHSWKTQYTCRYALTRFQIQEFKKAAPHMDKDPTPIPTNNFTPPWIRQFRDFWQALWLTRRGNPTEQLSKHTENSMFYATKKNHVLTQDNPLYKNGKISLLFVIRRVWNTLRYTPKYLH